jgi:hypothetical protein
MRPLAGHAGVDGSLPPRRAFGHGFLTKDGRKMALAGNVLDPCARIMEPTPWCVTACNSFSLRFIQLFTACHTYSVASIGEVFASVLHLSDVHAPDL